MVVELVRFVWVTYVAVLWSETIEARTHHLRSRKSGENSEFHYGREMTAQTGYLREEPPDKEGYSERLRSYMGTNDGEVSRRT